MSCFGDCMDMGPPPNSILFMPPPPAPLSLFPEFAPLNTSHCVVSHICDITTRTIAGKVALNNGEYVELPRNDVEETWTVSGLDGTWLLVLVVSSIGVLLLGALLAFFLLKCREISFLSPSNHCSLHTRDHRPTKTIESFDASLLNRNGKVFHGNDVNFFNGLHESRVVWAALTPRGTEHFISENYPRNLINYMESEDHYETIDNINGQPINHEIFKAYDSYHKGLKINVGKESPSFDNYAFVDYAYEDPRQLIERYPMNVEKSDEHQYQCIDNTDMRCTSMGYGMNSLGQSFSIHRPRVSSPTRIEHPNLPPLNLYPQRNNSNTLKKNTFGCVDTGTLPKYGM